MNDATTFCLRAGAASWRDVEQELVVLDLGSGVYFTLNGSARTLWLALDTGSTVGGLCELLTEGYGIERERASADVAAFLIDLENRGFIEQAS